MEIQASSVSRTRDDQLNNEHSESYTTNFNYNLTHLQEEIVFAIETLNHAFFVDLGGELELNLDFEIDKEGSFPLGVA